MAFPLNQDKFRFPAVIEPQGFKNYKRWNEKDFPSKYILTYQSRALDYFSRAYPHVAIPFGGTEGLLVHDGIGFAKISGIGAPHAATVFEELIAVGGTEFLNLGTAGGLQGKRGFVLCDSAIRDEGTSRHYTKGEDIAYPDAELMEALGNSFRELGVGFRKGRSWTTDAPYRETIAEVQNLRGEGVETVEMEASALFSIAKYRDIKVAAAFVVSDLVHEEGWKPEFHTNETNGNIEKLIGVGVNCLKKR